MDFISVQNKKAFQAYMLAPLAYIQSNGKRRLITERKKLYYWHRLKGCNKAKSARRAGYSESVAQKWTGKRREKPGELEAISKYFRLDEVDSDWVKRKLMGIIEVDSRNADKIRAVHLLSQLMGWLRESWGDRTSQQSMPVQFALPPPVCPRCGYRNTEYEDDPGREGDEDSGE